MWLIKGLHQHFTALQATTIRQVRSQTARSSLGFVTGFLEIFAYALIFYVAIELIGRRTMTLRGDVVTFLLTGIILFLLHKATVSAVQTAVTSNSQLLFHRPANTAMLIWSAALSQLYQTSVTVAVCLFANYVVFGVYEVQRPLGFVSMLLLAWLLGVGVGMVFAYLRYHISWIGLFSRAYSRLLFWTSGLFFAANQVPSSYLPYLDWNPVFHILDQSRGATFIHYTPHNTSLTYPILVTAIVFLLGRTMEASLSKTRNQSKL
jgi:ABC-type polysaccharide/polyol phosphate export permease